MVDKENSENLKNSENIDTAETEETILIPDENTESDNDGKAKSETGGTKDESYENAEEAEETKDNKDNKETKENKKDLKKLNAELEQKTEEYDILYNKYLRINAEYDNFRKRTAKEKEGIYSDAVIDVLNNILPTLDNIERALQFSENSENPEPEKMEKVEKVLEGVKMIHTQFINSLFKIGVEEIKAEGEQFNPEIHNAVFHEEDESKPDNTITEVLQKGYIKGDKVIRPAMVKVVN